MFASNDLSKKQWAEILFDWANENHIPDLKWNDRYDGYWSGFPRNYEDLVNLTELNIQDSINSLPPEIQNLSELEKVTLTCLLSEPITLPEEFWNLTNLISLDLSFFNFEKLPEKIARLVRLKKLALSANGISTFPNFIFNFKNLEILDLSANKLQYIPDAIENLTQLRALNLSGYLNIKACPISHISSNLNKLKNLETLHVTFHASITEIPSVIPSLVSLKNLFLSAESIVDVPYNFDNLINLEQLHLNFCNNLRKIPDQIFNLNQLKSLDMSADELSILPNRIYRLTNLEHLRLAYNEIRYVPEDILQLKKLNFIDLNSNNLLELPEDITSLGMIKGLILSENPNLVLSANQKEWLNFLIENGSYIRLDKDLFDRKKTFIHMVKNVETHQADEYWEDTF